VNESVPISNFTDKWLEIRETGQDSRVACMGLSIRPSVADSCHMTQGHVK